MSFLTKPLQNLKKRNSLPIVKGHERDFDRFFSQSGFQWRTGRNGFIDRLQECNPGVEIATDPSPKLKIYRAVNWAFPMFPRAVQIKSDLIGPMVYASDDKGLENRLNDFGEAFKLFNFMNNEEVITKGISNFRNLLFETGLKDGMGFGEMVEGEADSIDGITVFDSMDFEHLTLDGRQSRLFFRRNGRIMPIAEERG